MRTAYAKFILASALLFPIPVHAEPSAGSTHLLPLIVATSVGAAACGSVPFVVRKFSKVKRPLWQYAAVSAAMAVGFSAVAGPIIIALGSILLTGRTM